MAMCVVGAGVSLPLLDVVVALLELAALLAAFDDVLDEAPMSCEAPSAIVVFVVVVVVVVALAPPAATVPAALPLPPPPPPQAATIKDKTSAGAMR
ncbi:MAG: hypothetical protein QM639_01925 [Rhodocyclaceae bacterium]